MPGPTPSSRPAPPDDWDKHWDDLGESADGNPANTYRQRLIFQKLGISQKLGILPALGACSAEARVLDIGSGQGELAVLLRSRFPSSDVWGLEYGAEGVKRASERAQQAGLAVRFTQRDLLVEADPPEGDRGWATHAVCSEVLEHVDDPAVLLRNARPYLAPGCRVVVTVPSGPRSAFDRYIGHRRHFTPQSLRQTLVSGGFDPVSIERAGAPFFNLYRLTVMLRGHKLIEDLAKPNDSFEQSRMIKLAYRVFDAAFRLNLPSTPIGWQLVAVATPRRVTE